MYENRKKTHRKLTRAQLEFYDRAIWNQNNSERPLTTFFLLSSRQCSSSILTPHSHDSFPSFMVGDSILRLILFTVTVFFLFRKVLFSCNNQLRLKMVDALTWLSCWVCRRFWFLWSAMTGRSRLLASLDYFLILMNRFLFLTSGLLKDVHLYFMLQLLHCNPIGGCEDQMIVCRILL